MIRQKGRNVLTLILLSWLLLCCSAAHAFVVPDTGQGLCYTMTGAIDCPAEGEAFYGQDGSYSINPPVYTKLDESGNALPDNATAWVMVRDELTGLVWEVKTTDGSIHDKERTFDWTTAHETFIAELNKSKFGGFSDWRLPTTEELRTIRVKGAEPYIDLGFFPNTISTGYLSWRKCGSGEIYDERVKFGKIRNTKKDRRVRAVRSVQK